MNSPRRKINSGNIYCEYVDNHISITQNEKSWYYKLSQEPYCKICSHPIQLGYRHTDKCMMCNNVEDLYGFTRIYSVGNYYKHLTTDNLKEHILSFKREKVYGILLGLAVVLCIENRYPELKNVDLIIPVPIHDNKLLERGYNQAEILSEKISDEFNIPHLNDVLRKKSDGKMHTSSTRQERKNKVRGMYECIRRIDEYRHILLIDDMCTTGFTASECSRMLLEAGAHNVDVMVVGRKVYED